MSNDELEKEIAVLRQQIKELSDAFWFNNFPSGQDFQKYVRFNGRLKVPHYDTLPTVCEVGEVAESAGKLRICSAANTWSIVGT